MKGNKQQTLCKTTQYSYRWYYKLTEYEYKSNLCNINKYKICVNKKKIYSNKLNFLLFLYGHLADWFFAF